MSLGSLINVELSLEVALALAAAESQAAHLGVIRPLCQCLMSYFIRPFRSELNK